MPLETPIRLLLAAIFAIALPLLCCCGDAAAAAGHLADAHETMVATVVQPQSAADEHACCETTPPATDAVPDQAAAAVFAPYPQPDSEMPCDCDQHAEQMSSVLAERVAVPAPAHAGLLFHLPPLAPVLLASELLGGGSSLLHTLPDEPTAPAIAPTLRSLSVLLTV